MSDLCPTCPRCGDLSDAGSERCGTCRAPLTEIAAVKYRGDGPCVPHIVNAHGVAPDARGRVGLRVVGFRAHCDCGHLGKRRDNYFTARRDARDHKKDSTARPGSTVEVARPAAQRRPL